MDTHPEQSDTALAACCNPQEHSISDPSGVSSGENSRRRFDFSVACLHGILRIESDETVLAPSLGNRMIVVSGHRRIQWLFAPAISDRLARDDRGWIAGPGHLVPVLRGVRSCSCVVRTGVIVKGLRTKAGAREAKAAVPEGENEFYKPECQRRAFQYVNQSLRWRFQACGIEINESINPFASASGLWHAHRFPPGSRRFRPVQDARAGQREELDLDVVDAVFLAAEDLAVGMNHQGLL